LREVFDCDYDEIAEIIRKNAVTCRQMLRRAKQHILMERSRFEASPEQLEKLVRQFTNTCATGDLESFVSVLA
jgi:RNA polymerase sigma-70 factor (ECF subfamily)